MLRKWILSGVAGLTLLAPLAAVPAVQAHDRDDHREMHRDRDRDEHHRRRDFEVLYRSCCDDPWTCYGRFDCREEAEHAEHHLRARGYEAFVR
jgi:hypothetical protein